MFFVSTAFAISATVGPGDDLSSVVSTLGPGDVITFTGGVYELTDTLRVTEAVGTADRPVVFTRDAGGQEVLLKAIEGDTVFVLADSEFVEIRNLVFEGGEAWETEGGSGVVVQDSKSVTFTDNTVRNTRGDSLRLVGDTENLTIRDNRLGSSSAGTGIYVGCGNGSCWMSDSVIEHNLIHDTGTPDDVRSGIILDNGCQGNRVIENNVFNTSGLGIRVETTQLGAENQVLGNSVWNTGGHGIEVTGEALVQNNVVFQTAGSGIRSSNPDGDMRNVRITYNTVALNGQEGVELEGWEELEGMVFSSNVVANITGRGFRYQGHAELTNNRITANVISGLVEGVDLAVQTDWIVAGAGTGDFEDWQNWNFYPSTESTLAGTGDAASESWVPATDFNGTARNGEFPTVGALEYVGAGNPGWIIREDFKGEGAPVTPPDNAGGGCCKKKNDDTDAMALLLLPFLGLFAKRRREGSTPR